MEGPFIGLDLIKSMDEKTILITENGLYQLIMMSKLQFVKPFQKWVYEEVLPNIRKHGVYTHNFKINSNNFIDDMNYQNSWLLK